MYVQRSMVHGVRADAYPTIAKSANATANFIVLFCLVDWFDLFCCPQKVLLNMPLSSATVPFYTILTPFCSLENFVMFGERNVEPHFCFLQPRTIFRTKNSIERIDSVSANNFSFFPHCHR